MDTVPSVAIIRRKNSLEPRQRLSGLGQTEIDITTPAQGPVALGGQTLTTQLGSGERGRPSDRDSIQCYTGRVGEGCWPGDGGVG